MIPPKNAFQYIHSISFISLFSQGRSFFPLPLPSLLIRLFKSIKKINCPYGKNKLNDFDIPIFSFIIQNSDGEKGKGLSALSFENESLPP